MYLCYVSLYHGLSKKPQLQVESAWPQRPWCPGPTCCFRKLGANPGLVAQGLPVGLLAAVCSAGMHRERVGWCQPLDLGTNLYNSCLLLPQHGGTCGDDDDISVWEPGPLSHHVGENHPVHTDFLSLRIELLVCLRSESWRVLCGSFHSSNVMPMHPFSCINSTRIRTTNVWWKQETRAHFFNIF